MKKCFKVILIALISILVYSCNNTADKRLAGVWKLTTMEINGTTIQGSSLGNWLWEFNDEGGYLINISGAVEKGTYTLDKAQLQMKSVTVKDRSEQTYTIAQLDSSQLRLTSATGGNKSTLVFVKYAAEQGEND